MAKKNKNRVHTKKGLIKDVEANLLKIVKQTFQESDFQRYSKYTPQEFIDQDATKANIINLPAMYVWNSNIETQSAAMGGQSGRSVSEMLFITCNVYFITDIIIEKEVEDGVKEIGWSVQEMIHENLNLNGIANAGGSILSANMQPDILMVEEQMKPVSVFKVTVQYKKTRRKKRRRK